MIPPQLAATGPARVARICRMPSQIELYEEMSLLSSRMAAAARALCRPDAASRIVDACYSLVRA